MKLPKEWEFRKLGTVVSKQKYAMVDGPFGSNLKSEHYKTSGIPVLQSGFVTSGKFFAKSYVYVDKELFDQQRRSAAKGGDLLMAKIGAQAGKCAIIPLDHPESIIAGNCLKLSFDEEQNSTEFFNMVLAYNYDKNGLCEIKTETAQPAISLKSLKDYKVPVPPLSEQKKIAKILSTWDQAISATEKMLENSQQQKKALMQQLLTGKKRLLDENGISFSEEWQDYHLNKIAEVIVSPVDKKSEPNELPVELCNYTDVYYNNLITKKISFMKATAKKAEIEKYRLKKGDVIITKDSETPGDIAIPALVSEDLNGVVCGYHLAIIRPKSELIDGAFLNYLFSMQKTRYYFFTLATGATRFGLSIGAINKAHFRIPNISEQQKIAEILFLVDQETETLQKKLDCLKQEKKALMQQLLTGKKRVKVAA
ncbi:MULTISPECIES: restriction endonuclease subunit S [Acinetobacter calcoaceticus/baumannii complex]|uniref:restriction endonuclease subunit S n=1 Tax=Acinetobacter calcoaceticus/baumannii complex TaxID=909768 RepID=UPI0011A48585|nr:MULTISPECIES: restriction endonuclease subunit S [Acinetobacter calcoaceticus/baumannii complex]MCP9173664.1 restriction endonuclease subunit S [Acinetobacter baumannii]MDQ8922728.1 restriction endonuclease subunit S [Acinetobacter baumannii]MDQ8926139.1 restriction endonuclease subunit S [Acinetobacter baumannii]MDQ8933051.1 restriction endonuclease subunit S [Acinetobacter baumannii]MDQ9036433.1 restriction endonuclease subunit S [Acinetobacter seifertii]